ncbi:MAG: hypothetical protein COB39_04875 [Marinosulfonomonas sp.]|nr:MAG: hypothetical protein COB39_04875 [Marinosulfonomonas sp.]
MISLRYWAGIGPIQVFALFIPNVGRMRKPALHQMRVIGYLTGEASDCRSGARERGVGWAVRLTDNQFFCLPCHVKHSFSAAQQKYTL